MKYTLIKKVDVDINEHELIEECIYRLITRRVKIYYNLFSLVDDCLKYIYEIEFDNWKEFVDSVCKELKDYYFEYRETMLIEEDFTKEQLDKLERYLH